MTIRLEGTGYRRLRGDVVGTVRAVDGDTVIFVDYVNLSRARSRDDFIAAVGERLNGSGPTSAEGEFALIMLLLQAEAQLNMDAAAAAPAEADDEARIEGYALRNGRYEAIRVKETSAGPIETRIPLSNFGARITEDITLDDGAEWSRDFAIEGELAGRPLPPVRVAADEFGSMNWVPRAWGVQARVLPGQGRKDLLRDAVQAFSFEARSRTIFSHLGWRRVDGRLLFLHGGGAIGDSGAVDEVEVELDGKLALYRLPDPSEETLVEDVRASWDVWAVAPMAVSAPLGGVVYGAPLAEWLRPAFTLWLRGPTGRLKTTFATLGLAHFGPFDVKEVPANWEATANHLEKQAFLVKDLPFLIDDFRPPSDRNEAGEMRRKAARLIRAAGNRAGRGRMRADTTLRPEYWPRGVVIATAEEQAPGESTAARVWDVDFSDVAIDLADLTAAQGRTEALGRAMAAYIRSLAADLEGGDGWLRDTYQESADRARGVGRHPRHPQTLAYLFTAWITFARFAVEVGAVTNDEAVERLVEVERALRGVAERQAEVALAVRPDVVFVRTLGDLLAGGKAHLAGTDASAPPEAQAWGWRLDQGRDDEGMPADAWRPLGEKLGWVDDDNVYLIPSLAHRLVAKTVSERGDAFIVSPQALGEALERGGFLVRGTERRRHHIKKVAGQSHTTIRLSRRALDATWGDAP